MFEDVLAFSSSLQPTDSLQKGRRKSQNILEHVTKNAQSAMLLVRFCWDRVGFKYWAGWKGLVAGHFSEGLVEFVGDGFEFFFLVDQFICSECPGRRPPSPPPSSCSSPWR